jgi:hypothetical protein
MERSTSGAPRCAQGHLVTTEYTIADVRTLEVLVFRCEECAVEWQASPEERDAFLQYLESRPDDVVPS